MIPFKSPGQKPSSPCAKGFVKHALSKCESKLHEYPY